MMANMIGMFSAASAVIPAQAGIQRRTSGFPPARERRVDGFCAFQSLGSEQRGKQ